MAPQATPGTSSSLGPHSAPRCFAGSWVQPWGSPPPPPRRLLTGTGSEQRPSLSVLRPREAFLCPRQKPAGDPCSLGPRRGDRRGASAAPLCLPLQPPHEPRAWPPSWDQASCGPARGRRPVASPCALQTDRPFPLRIFGMRGQKGTGPRSLWWDCGLRIWEQGTRGRPPAHLRLGRALRGVAGSQRPSGRRPGLSGRYHSHQIVPSAARTPSEMGGLVTSRGGRPLVLSLGPPPLLAPSLPPQPESVRPTGQAHTFPLPTAPEPVTPGREVTQGTRPRDGVNADLNRELRQHPRD